MDQRRVELLTPALSERCSNQLSYWSSVWHHAYCGGLSLRLPVAHVLDVPTGTSARSLASDFAKVRPRYGLLPNWGRFASPPSHFSPLQAGCQTGLHNPQRDRAVRSLKKEREILQQTVCFRHCDHRDVDDLTFLV